MKDFRNHSETHVHCSPNINMFLGNNGEGKTNILEGISYLCLARSFFAVSDELVVKIGTDGFWVGGDVVTDGGTSFDVRVEFDKNACKKLVKINGGSVEKASLLVGKFPIVILAPNQNVISTGASSARRKFVDLVLSQASRKYLETLIEYRRILKQRNAVLAEIAARRNHRDALEPWNKILVSAGAGITIKRLEFIEDFKRSFGEAYGRLMVSDETPSITYTPSVPSAPGAPIADVQSVFEHTLLARSEDEVRVGYSLVGPHRDEIGFGINGLDVRDYASQGQHKSVLVALKLAEFSYLKERCQETPVLLLDDVFSELDSRRIQSLMSGTAELGQIFLTATDEYTAHWSAASNAAVRKFFVRQGSIERVEEDEAGSEIGTHGS
jgi:DNA replication and repair protein RecF